MATRSSSLSSSALSSCTYDEDTRTLSIRFTSGQSYTYSDVPVEVYEELVNSSSPGRFFHGNIKGTYV